VISRRRPLLALFLFFLFFLFGRQLPSRSRRCARSGAVGTSSLKCGLVDELQCQVGAGANHGAICMSRKQLIAWCASCFDFPRQTPAHRRVGHVDGGRSLHQGGAGHAARFARRKGRRLRHGLSAIRDERSVSRGRSTLSPRPPDALTAHSGDMRFEIDMTVKRRCEGSRRRGLTAVSLWIGTRARCKSAAIRSAGAATRTSRGRENLVPYRWCVRRAGGCPSGQQGG